MKGLLFHLLLRLNRHNWLPRWVSSTGGDNAGWANRGAYIDLPAGVSLTVSGDLG